MRLSYTEEARLELIEVARYNSHEHTAPTSTAG